MKYVNKKKTAEEMEQQFQKMSSTDYSLKEGETLVLEIKNKAGGGGTIKSKFFEQGLNHLSLEERGNQKESAILIKPPPPPPTPIGTVDNSPPIFSLEHQSGMPLNLRPLDVKDDDDDFGDFQAAG